MYFHDILIFVATGMVNCDANKDPVALKAANKSMATSTDAPRNSSSQDNKK